LKNKNLIAVILKDGGELFRNSYRNTFNSEFSEPLSPAKLDLLHKKSLTTAANSLAAMLKEKNASWLEKETEYQVGNLNTLQNSHH
jgi:hypothetical protein